MEVQLVGAVVGPFMDVVVPAHVELVPPLQAQEAVVNTSLDIT